MINLYVDESIDDNDSMDSWILEIEKYFLSYEGKYNDNLLSEISNEFKKNGYSCNN